MRILVLTDRFHPEVAAPSVRILDHARHWQAHGHDVTVLTGAPNFPRGTVFPGYRNRLYQEETVEGIRTIRVWSYMAENRGFLRRTLDYLSLVASSVVWMWRVPRFDVVLATSPPLFTALQGFLFGLLRRRPWVFEVRDLWPASIQAVGASRSRLLVVLERLELWLYRKADAIVLLTDSFRGELERRRAPVQRAVVARNGVEADRFRPTRRSEDVRSELGFADGQFVAAYIGTTGMAHGLDTVVEAAAAMQDDPDVAFLIMGEGAERPHLEARCKALGLTNITFRDFVPHAEIASYLAAVDVSIVHLRPDPLFRTVIPSKIFEAMAVGTPILMGVEGESAALVEASGAGVLVPPGDAEAMASAVKGLASDPQAWKRMGAAGASAARTSFSRHASAMRVLSALASARGRRRGGRS